MIVIIARSAMKLALVARGRTNDTGQSAASFAFVLPASTTLTSVIDGNWFLTGLASVASLAIVPFLHGGVVLQHHWRSEQQFLDAVAVALITPGLVVITVAFIGYPVAGPLGATAAAAGVFAPVYCITLLLAPHYERYKSNPRVRDFIAGVTAAATGAIAGATIVLGRRAIVDWTTIAIASLTLLLRKKKIPEPLLIVGSGRIAP